MNSSLSIAILAGLGGMLGWGLADFFAKKTVDRIGDLPSLVWAHFFGTALFVCLAVFNFLVTGHFVHLPSSWLTLLALAGFGILQAVVYWLVYKGFSKGQLAVLNPVFASYSGFVALFSIIFFSENLSLGISFGLAAVFLGILVMNTDLPSLRSKRLNIVPGLPEVATAAILAAVWTILWDRFVHGHDSLGYAMLMYFFMSLAALAAAKSQKTNLTIIGKGLWRLLALIGLGEMVAYLSISLGFSKTSHTSIVALISGSFSVPTLILAHIYLKERVTKLQLASVVVIILGIITIALSTG
jgi:drug/metabolite transporter (DMT)-like permease